MDASRFDDLTKALAAGTSRRRVLKSLLAGAAGGALSLVGLRRAGASHGRPPGATCLRNEHCASGLCDPQTRRCTCPAGTAACGGQCVSTTCPEGATLSSASCQCVCTATGQPPCGTGAAAVCCAEDLGCVGGTCQYTCPAGADVCTLGVEDPSSFCGPEGSGCACFRTMSGAPFCAYGAFCVACETDADCTDMGHPPGTVCVDVTGGFCEACFGPGGGGSCALPCPT